MARRRANRKATTTAKATIPPTPIPTTRLVAEAPITTTRANLVSAGLAYLGSKMQTVDNKEICTP